VTLQLGSGIDCDVHPAVPSLAALFPYLGDHWREILVTRGLNDLDTISYPPNAPISCRPDWRPRAGKLGADLGRLATDALDHFGSGIAIVNCLYGIQTLFSEDLAAALARAVNDLIVHELLDREPRLRASIVIAPQSVERAVDEVERCAVDPRCHSVVQTTE
jgi:predicted TIM-barrel fold metal-dependent hydrolase